MRFSQERLRALILGLFFALVFILYAELLRNEDATLKVAFLDVGQGDAVFIESPNGNQMLVDAGADPRVLRELRDVMPFYDRTIDVIVATHPDRDHIGGLPDILIRYDTGLLLRSGAVNDTGVFQALNDVVSTREIPTMLARRGMVIDFGDGVHAEVLFPDRDVSSVDPNNASIIMHVVHGDVEVMLTGDAPKEIEAYLASLDGELLASDILKAGHHGSDTSSSESFLGHVAPRVAVVSAGADNRYGHPHDEVLKRLSRFNINTLSTADEGSIVFESNGSSFYRRR